MRKYLAISKEELNKLPAELVAEVTKTLKCFDETHVIYQNGKHEETTGIFLLAKYPSDYKFVGTVYAEDIFTAEERAYNYIVSFGDRYTSRSKLLTETQICAALAEYEQSRAEAVAEYNRRGGNDDSATIL